MRSTCSGVILLMVGIGSDTALACRGRKLGFSLKIDAERPNLETPTPSRGLHWWWTNRTNPKDGKLWRCWPRAWVSDVGATGAGPASAPGRRHPSPTSAEQA